MILNRDTVISLITISAISVGLWFLFMAISMAIFMYQKPLDVESPYFWTELIFRSFPLIAIVITAVAIYVSTLSKKISYLLVSFLPIGLISVITHFFLLITFHSCLITLNYSPFTNNYLEPKDISSDNSFLSSV